MVDAVARPGSRDNFGRMSELEFLGDIAAVNASLNIMVADGDVMVGYNGAGADNQRAIEFLTTSPYDQGWYGRLAIGASDAVVVSLDVACGVASVYRIAPDRFAIVEPCQENFEEELEDDPDGFPEDFLAQIAAVVHKPPRAPSPSGAIEIPSGLMVIGDCYDAYSDQAADLAGHRSELPGAVLPLEGHLSSLAIRVTPGAYRVSRVDLDLGWSEIGIAFIER